MPCLKKCRNNRKLRPEVDFQDCYLSDGILCSIKIRCCPFRMQDEQFNSVQTQTKFHQEEVSGDRDQWKSTGILECLEDALRLMNKEDLCHYIAQLLMEQRPLNIFRNSKPNEHFTTNEEEINSNLPRVQTRREKQRVNSSWKNINFPTASLPQSEDKCEVRHGADIVNNCRMALNGNDDMDDEAFRKIVRIIDLLCNMRPLIDEVSHENHQHEQRDSPLKCTSQEAYKQQPCHQLRSREPYESKSDSSLCYEQSEPLIAVSPTASEAYLSRSRARKMGHYCSQNVCHDQKGQVPEQSGCASSPNCKSKSKQHFSAGLSTPAPARDWHTTQCPNPQPQHENTPMGLFPPTHSLRSAYLRNSSSRE